MKDSSKSKAIIWDVYHRNATCSLRLYIQDGYRDTKLMYFAHIFSELSWFPFSFSVWFGCCHNISKFHPFSILSLHKMCLNQVSSDLVLSPNLFYFVLFIVDLMVIGLDSTFWWYNKFLKINKWSAVRWYAKDIRNNGILSYSQWERNFSTFSIDFYFFIIFPFKFYIQIFMGGVATILRKAFNF